MLRVIKQNIFKSILHFARCSQRPSVESPREHFSCAEFARPPRNDRTQGRHAALKSFSGVSLNHQMQMITDDRELDHAHATTLCAKKCPSKLSRKPRASQRRKPCRHSHRHVLRSPLINKFTFHVRRLVRKSLLATSSPPRTAALSKQKLKLLRRLHAIEDNSRKPFVQADCSVSI